MSLLTGLKNGNKTSEISLKKHPEALLLLKAIPDYSGEPDTLCMENSGMLFCRMKYTENML
jgi:hypothetical protein